MLIAGDRLRMKVMCMQALDSRAPDLVQCSWFSIVGAPRCGTTSLARHLASHPQIYFSKPKEPHFFSQRDLRKYPFHEADGIVREEYLERFFPGRPHGVVLAEGSVSYLYAPERLLPALRIWPDARFVVAVRNPLEMLPSLHRRNFYNGDETVGNFGRAWSMVDDRRRGLRIPRTCIDPRVLDYKEIGQLGKHVRRFMEAVGRDRCFISVFDDLAAQPRRHHVRLLEFLGLPFHFPEQFRPYRCGSDVRFGWLQRLLKRPPKLVRTFFASEALLVRDGAIIGSRATGPSIDRKLAVRKRLLAWNRKKPDPIKLDAHLYQELRDFFGPDVGELSALIGRDLGHWLNPTN